MGSNYGRIYMYIYRKTFVLVIVMMKYTCFTVLSMEMSTAPNTNGIQILPFLDCLLAVVTVCSQCVGAENQNKLR